MKHILFITLISLGFSISIHAKTESQRYEAKSMSEAKIKKMDHKHTRHKAKKRKFKTQKEFKHQRRQVHRKGKYKHDNYNNGRHYNSNYVYRDHRRSQRQRGFSHSKRGWILAYRYDRASFYDREGYYYGYFNRQGYYFEDVFYRYDRYYTFRDRMEGRGLFDYSYYIPENYRYYGFYNSPNTY